MQVAHPDVDARDARTSLQIPLVEPSVLQVVRGDVLNSTLLTQWPAQNQLKGNEVRPLSTDIQSTQPITTTVSPLPKPFFGMPLYVLLRTQR